MVYNDYGFKNKEKIESLNSTDMRPLYPPDEEQATMLYTPKYCCQCGEKIERENWSVLTSRRFCGTCEIEFKGHETLIKVGAFLMIVFGLFGTGSLLIKREKTPEIKSSQITQNALNERGGNSKEQKNIAPNPVNQVPNQPVANQAIQPPPALIAAKPATQNNSPIAAVKASENKSPEDGEPSYFCGAATKKGTPCSRRVKGGGRCWQHPGQPAMLPPEKLLIAAR